MRKEDFKLFLTNFVVLECEKSYINNGNIRKILEMIYILSINRSYSSDIIRIVKRDIDDI